MQLRIHTNQNVTILEHTRDMVRQEQVNYATIESNTRVGSCRFRIIETTIGQVWIGDYDIEENYRLQLSRPVIGLLVAIHCTPVLPSKVMTNKTHFPFQSMAWFAQNNNRFEMSFLKGKGHLLLFSYENGLSVFSDVPNFHRTLSGEQPKLWPDNDIINLVESVLNYPLINDRLQAYLRIKSEELVVLLQNESEKMEGSIPLPAHIISKMLAIDKLIKTDLERNYSITDLARYTHVSVSNLKKYFKSYFSKSVHQYLLGVKMEEAGRRINDTGESLKNIAFNLGFKSEQNFSAAFKNFYGYPPGQLRKRS